jgi:hypothetical protein
MIYVLSIFILPCGAHPEQHVRSVLLLLPREFQHISSTGCA